jgi:hypothetical protein
MDWYNLRQPHSGISSLTPPQGNNGDGVKICGSLSVLYEQACCRKIRVLKFLERFWRQRVIWLKPPSSKKISVCYACHDCPKGKMALSRHFDITAKTKTMNRYR